MIFRNTPWARWAWNTSTVLLWTMALGGLFVLGVLVWTIWADNASVRQFYAYSSRVALQGNVLDLSKVADVGQIRLLTIPLTVAAGVFLGAVFLVLTRLRRLLKEVLSGRPFSSRAVPDLKLIGTVLLVGGVAVTLLSNLIVAAAVTVIPGYSANYNLTPDFILLFCGFLVRTLAEVFAHGEALQSEADLTV